MHAFGVVARLCVAYRVQSLRCAAVCSAPVSRHHSLWRSQQIHASSCASCERLTQCAFVSSAACASPGPVRFLAGG